MSGDQQPDGRPEDRPEEPTLPLTPPTYPGYGDQPPYPAQPPQGYPAQPYPGQPYPPQGYPAQPHPGQPYPAQPYPGQPYGYRRPDHPKATTALVLGLVAVVGAVAFAGLTLVVSPFAWVVGHRARREIRASGGYYGGESNATAGMVLGIIGTILLVLGILAVIALIAIFVIIADTGWSTSAVNAGLLAST